MHSKKNTNKRSHHPEQINTLALLNTCVSSEEHNIYKKYIVKILLLSKIKLMGLPMHEY